MDELNGFLILRITRAKRVPHEWFIVSSKLQQEWSRAVPGLLQKLIDACQQFDRGTNVSFAPFDTLAMWKDLVYSAKKVQRELSVPADSNGERLFNQMSIDIINMLAGLEVSDDSLKTLNEITDHTTVELAQQLQSEYNRILG
jgi:hypothetical protein